MSDIAFLVPTHNDEWTLNLCLEAIHNAAIDVDVHVLENGSTDRTARVADWWAEYDDAILSYHVDRPLDNAERRNLLMEKVPDRHLCFIDADMILIEQRADTVVELAADSDVEAKRFRLCQPWGDWQHIARECHSDRCCHLYVDRDAFEDFAWSETPAGFGVNGARGCGATDILFWHLNGVRPDYRIVNRDVTREYFAGDLEESPPELVDDLSDAEVHHRAVDWLRGSRTIPIDEADTPPVPRVMARRWPGRFELVLSDGEIIDRLDTDWKPPWEAYGNPRERNGND